jgi:hypothetical protein
MGQNADSRNMAPRKLTLQALFQPRARTSLSLSDVVFRLHSGIAGTRRGGGRCLGHWDTPWCVPVVSKFGQMNEAGKPGERARGGGVC